jgi:site-specific recombinase XerD
MRETRDGQPSITLEKALAVFLDALSGKNRSAATIRAYQTDLSQFVTFLHDTNVLITSPQDIQKVDVLEYFSYLSKKALTGVARARKMSALQTASQHCLLLWGMKPTVLDQCHLSDLHTWALAH